MGIWITATLAACLLLLTSVACSASDIEAPFDDDLLITRAKDALAAALLPRHRISARSGVPMIEESTSGVRSNKTSRDDSSNCHSLPSEIHVTKEEADETGNVVRVCEGTIRVAKCEGTCLSELRPSVHSPTGFAKVCLDLTP